MSEFRVAGAGLGAMRQDLLHRADAAARQAGNLAIDWFWIRLELRTLRAERLLRAAESAALVAHRLR